MADPIRAALERLATMANDELTTPGPWAHSYPDWAAAIAAARAALLADGPAVPEGREPAAVAAEAADEELKAAGRKTAMCGGEESWLECLEQVAYAASDFICGTRFPEFANQHGGIDRLMADLCRLVAQFEHGPRPVPGVDVPGPDGDWGGLAELCNAEGVDLRIGVPLLQRAREAWGIEKPPAPTPAPALDANTLKEVFIKAIARDLSTGWATLADYIALAVEAQRAPSGNPPATEESWEDAQRTVAERNSSHIAVSLLQLAAVNARQSRWLSSALCERAATLLRQPAPAVVPVAVSERPWEREGWCDADGRCWWSHGPTPTARWNFLPMDGMDEANGWLLPHWAIPIPQLPHGGEVEQ